MRRPLSSSKDCPEAPSSGLCSPSREPKRPKQGFDVSPKLSANSARDRPSTCWREVSAICQTGSNAALHGAGLAYFLRKPAFGHRRTRREEGHLLMLVQRIFMRGQPDTPTIHLGVRRPTQGLYKI